MPEPPDPLTTIPARLAADAAADPDAPALLTPAGVAITRGALQAAIASVTAQLRALGVGPQDRVVVPLPNGTAPALLMLGLLASCVPVPLHLTIPEAELAATLARLRPATLLDLGDRPGLRDAAGRVGTPVLRVVIDLSPLPSVRIEGRAVGPPAPDRRAGPDDLAMIVTTSGTTGRGKLVPRTHRNLAASSVEQVRVMETGPSDRTLLLTPICHTLGLNTLWRSVVAGHPIVCPDRFAPVEIADLVVRHDPTWLSFAPAMLDDVLTVAEGRRDLPNPSLRFVRCGGANLVDPLRAHGEQVLGVPVFNGYGMSEATNLTIEGFSRPPRPGTAGPVAAPVRVVGDDGAPVPDGETGEVQTRGALVFPGYWDDPDLTAAAFTPDGWFRTGDRGLLRDGYLTLRGRADDVINRGGQKVDPLEVEQALATHPAVAEAAVFGLPDPRLGQEVAVAVVRRPGASLSKRDVRRWLLDRLAPHKVPRVVTFVDSLPRTASGKVRRRDLAEDFSAPPPVV